MQRECNRESATISQRCVELFELLPTSPPHRWLIAADWIEELGSEITANAFRDGIWGLVVEDGGDGCCGGGMGDGSGYACGYGGERGNFLIASGYGDGSGDGSGDGHGNIGYLGSNNCRGGPPNGDGLGSVGQLNDRSQLDYRQNIFGSSSSSSSSSSNHQ